MKRIIGIITTFSLVLCILRADKPPEAEGYFFLDKQRNLVNGADLQLVPGFSGRDEFIATIVAEEPVICQEILYTMPLPQLSEGEDLLLFLLNRLCRISTMAGIEYYSSRRDRMHPYITEAYLHDSGNNPVLDPVFTELPTEQTFQAFIRDTSFGGNRYDINLRAYPDAVSMSMTNTSTLWFFIFPALWDRELKISFIVTPDEDELVFYAVCQLKEESVGIGGFSVYLPGSFDHRISSLQSWFADQTYDN